MISSTRRRRIQINRLGRSVNMRLSIKNGSWLLFFILLSVYIIIIVFVFNLLIFSNRGNSFDDNNNYPTPKPVKIYLDSSSMFQTGRLDRFGTGKIDYLLDQQNDCNNMHEDLLEDDVPCLAINRVGSMCSYDDMILHYPKCRTMITNDEFCEESSYDVRGYYSSAMKNSVYLPLGPRYDSWEALEAIMNTNGSTIVSSSQRKYAFNAIFSKSTSAERSTVADVIQKEGNTLSSFVNIAEYWEADPNNPDNDLTDTTTYMQALLDSTFTLAPSGHNPECFRLYEAVETGSIPVISLGKDYSRHSCKDSLIHWLDSPIIVLDDWNNAIPTLQKLMSDPEALDQRQAELRSWYDQYMRNTVREFESFLLDER